MYYSLWIVITTCLTVKPHPDWSLVTEPSVCTMRSCALLFSWMRSLISDCFACWPFSTVLSQVFWQKCLVEMSELVWVPFPVLGLLELCQLAYLQYWVLCVWPIQDLPRPSLHPFVSFTASWSGLWGFFYGTEVCFDLLHFLSGLHWWEV